MEAENVKAWVKLSKDVPWWPCCIYFRHPPNVPNSHLSYSAAVLRQEKNVLLFLSGPTAKEFWHGTCCPPSPIDKYHDGGLGQWCPSSTVKPFCENFERNYLAVMDSDKWGDGNMQEHFMDCVRLLVADESIGLLAIIHFSLLNPPSSSNPLA